MKTLFTYLLTVVIGITTAHAANRGIAVTDADAVERSVGKSQVVYGKVSKVVWASGGPRKTPMGGHYFYVYFEGSNRFGLIFYDNAYVRSPVKRDEHAQQLVGQVIRVEGVIQPKHPKNPIRLTPALSITVDLPNAVRFASAEDIPKPFVRSEEQQRQLDQIGREINQLEAEAKKLAEENLDLVLLIAARKFKDMDMSDVCMPRYQVFEGRWRKQRRRQRTKKSDFTFARFVASREWELRGKDPERVRIEKKDHNCGHKFLWNLRRGKPSHSKAMFYAMAAFEAHHTLDPTDNQSASNLKSMYVVYDFNNQKQINYWEKKRVQRNAKVKGKVGDPTIGKKKKFTVYDYGDVPEGYVPPIPNLPPNRALRIKMEKITPGQLLEIEVSPFGRWHLYQTFADFLNNPRARKMYEDDVNAVIESQPLVLECVYQSEKFRRVNYYRYWYQTRPPAADPQYLSRKWRDHPLLFIRSPRDHCPAKSHQAKSHQ